MPKNEGKKKQKSTRWQKQKREDDPVMTDAHPGDLIIALMGPTGSGKSTFINEYFGDKRAQVGNNLPSCTCSIAWYRTILSDGPYAGRRLVLVDTPGSDNTYLDDSEILRRIAVWLAASYAADMSLAGVLYLQDISQKRMLGSTQINLKIIQSLLGLHCKGTSPTVALVTSQWDTVKEEAGKERENELKRSFWKEAIEGGATVHRVDGVGPHARIVEAVLDAKGKSDASVHMQHELVDKERITPLLEAGQQLRHDRNELLKYQAKIAKDVDEKKQKETAAKIESLQQQLNESSVSLKDRISNWARSFRH